MTVPVATVQVGCVTVATGVAGRAGRGLMTTEIGVDSQPTAFFTFIKYVPDANAGLWFEF